jgi:hypothetical protein
VNLPEVIAMKFPCFNCPREIEWDDIRAGFVHTATGKRGCVENPGFSAAPANYPRCGAERQVETEYGKAFVACDRPRDGHKSHTATWAKNDGVAGDLLPLHMPFRWIPGLASLRVPSTHDDRVQREDPGGTQD